MTEVKIGDKVNIVTGPHEGRTATVTRMCKAMTDWCYVMIDKRGRERVDKRVIIEVKHLEVAA